jgi:phosphate starvation-inducible PhoH-like protein
LDGVEGISIVRLTHKDVVRHELVQRIIQAYERDEKQREERKRDRSIDG